MTTSNNESTEKLSVKENTVSQKNRSNPSEEIYVQRQASLASWIAKEGIDAVLFEDSENHREPAIRYFTGHPSDAVLIISADGKTALSPWDVNLAEKLAHTNISIPFTTFDRMAISAAKGLLSALKIQASSKIEIPPSTPYPLFLQYVDTLSGYDIRCHNNGAHQHAVEMRAIKDCFELTAIRKACSITDSIIDNIEKGVKDGSITTETDAALLIERECRKAGCERTGFDTLAAGPERSYGIHCFPSYTAGAFPADGLSILDFGVVIDGYTSDVTLTIAKGELSAAQEKLVTLVEKAYKGALSCYSGGSSIKNAALKVDEIFSKGRRSMPHGLGHGIGLETHESPFVRTRVPEEALFLPGMVVTCEPGLYDSKLGGCRLENDVLITASGCEVLTHSRIIRI